MQAVCWVWWFSVCLVCCTGAGTILTLIVGCFCHLLDTHMLFYICNLEFYISFKLVPLHFIFQGNCNKNPVALTKFSWAVLGLVYFQSCERDLTFSVHRETIMHEITITITEHCNIRLQHVLNVATQVI